MTTNSRPIFSRSTALAALAAIVLASGTGCVRRELVSFADHESKPLTAINVAVTRSYVFWSSKEYVFYSCAEQGEKLACKRLCGGSNDVVCPEVQGAGANAQTNIR
jgi:hypothetical protein